MSWDLGRWRSNSLKQNISPCFFTLPLPRFAISFYHTSCSLKGRSTLMSYYITSPPSVTIYEELHSWVIKSILFIKSIFFSTLAVIWSLLLCVFSSFPVHFSWDLFSSALYHLPFSRLILSRCLSLQLFGEAGRLFQCMRPDKSLCSDFGHLFSFLVSFLSTGAVSMWRDASSLKLDIVH